MSKLGNPSPGSLQPPARWSLCPHLVSNAFLCRCPIVFSKPENGQRSFLEFFWAAGLIYKLSSWWRYLCESPPAHLERYFLCSRICKENIMKYFIIIPDCLARLKTYGWLLKHHYGVIWRHCAQQPADHYPMYGDRTLIKLLRTLTPTSFSLDLLMYTIISKWEILQKIRRKRDLAEQRKKEIFWLAGGERNLSFFQQIFCL